MNSKWSVHQSSLGLLKELREFKRIERVFYVRLEGEEMKSAVGNERIRDKERESRGKWERVREIRGNRGEIN